MASRRPPPRRRRPPPQRRRRRGGSDLGRRILWAIPLIAFAVFIVVEGGLIFTIGLLVVGIVCMGELFEMVDALRPVKLAGFLALIALAFAALYGTTYNVLLMMVALLPVLFFLTVGRPHKEGRRSRWRSPCSASGGSRWPSPTPCSCAGCPTATRSSSTSSSGRSWATPAAYVGGRAFGRRPLAPDLSPNKTLEGLIIGMAFAVAGVWFAGLYQDWLSGVDALLLGVAVAFAAPVGDLFESLIKRDAGAKDTGSMLGPHGGLLDRIDAVLFSVPIAFYVWHALM